jgi:hypothetical protein
MNKGLRRFNKERPIGKFSNVPKNTNGYYPITLIKIFFFDNLPVESDL